MVTNDKCGVYAIIAPSGKRYIGSSIDINQRFRQHRFALRHNNHFSLALQRAANKYGIDNLIFSKLFICRAEDRIMYEQRAIDIFKPTYNSRSVANTRQAFHHSEQTKKNLRALRLNKRHSDATKRAIGNASRGNTYCLGNHLSDEHKCKLSVAAKSKPAHDNVKAALLAANLGKNKSPDAIARRQATRSKNFIATFDQEIIDALITDYFDGCSLRELERRYDICRKTIKSLFMALGEKNGS